jgi:hypothetical protein
MRVGGSHPSCKGDYRGVSGLVTRQALCGQASLIIFDSLVFLFHGWKIALVHNGAMAPLPLKAANRKKIEELWRRGRGKQSRRHRTRRKAEWQRMR